MRDLTPCARCRRHIPAGASCPFCARRAAGLAIVVAASVVTAACGSETKPTPEVPTDTATSATADPGTSATAAPAATATATATAAASDAPTAAPTDPAPVASGA